MPVFPLTLASHALSAHRRNAPCGLLRDLALTTLSKRTMRVIGDT